MEGHVSVTPRNINPPRPRGSTAASPQRLYAARGGNQGSQSTLDPLQDNPTPRPQTGPPKDTAGKTGFFADHKLAIIVAVIILCVFILVLYVYLTRRGGSSKNKKPMEEGGDAAAQQIDKREVARLRAMRRAQAGERATEAAKTQPSSIVAAAQTQGPPEREYAGNGIAVQPVGAAVASQQPVCPGGSAPPQKPGPAEPPEEEPAKIVELQQEAIASQVAPENHPEMPSPTTSFSSDQPAMPSPTESQAVSLAPPTDDDIESLIGSLES